MTPTTFSPSRPGGAKVKCDTCGRTGYPWPGYPTEAPPAYWWATACRRGHAPCTGCGKQYSRSKLGKARRHPRCGAR